MDLATPTATYSGLRGGVTFALFAVACGQSNGDADHVGPARDAGSDGISDVGADAPGKDVLLEASAPSCAYDQPALELGEDQTQRVVAFVDVGGEYAFSTWRAKSGSGGSAQLYRTHLVTHQSELVFEAQADLTLIGANDTRVFLTTGAEFVDTLLELDHAGTQEESYDLSAQVLKSHALRVGATAYILSNGELRKAAAGNWTTLESAPGFRFVSPTTVSTPIVHDGASGKLCLLDEAQGSFQPCVVAPANAGDLNPLYDVTFAVESAGVWALQGSSPNGGAVSRFDGASWTPLYVTQHQSFLNGLALRDGELLWLDQRGLDLVTFETSLMSEDATHAPSTLWTLAGQAYGLMNTGDCELSVVVKHDGLYFGGAP